MVLSLKIVLVAILFVGLYFIVEILNDFIAKRKDSKRDSLERINNSYIKVTAKAGLFEKFLRTTKIRHFSYDSAEKHLKSIGGLEALPPVKYFYLKILSYIICVAMAYSFNISYLAILVAIPGYFALDLLIYVSDKSEMKKISMELIDVYDLVVVQSEAGIEISDSIQSAYLMVSHKRLKNDLSILAAKLDKGADINEALSDFNERYRNNEIDTFVMAVKQSAITGDIATILVDLSKSLRDSTEVIVEEETKKIDSKVQMLLYLLYGWILAVVVYSMVVELGSEFKNLI